MVIFVVWSSSMFLVIGEVGCWEVSVWGERIGFSELGVVGLCGSKAEIILLTLGVCLGVLGVVFMGVEVPLGKISGL